MNKLCAPFARPLKPIIEAEIQTLTVPYFQASLISLARAWNRCEEESLSLEREEIRNITIESLSAFVQRVLIRLVTELSALSLCQNIGTIPKIHTHSLSQASHGELCVNNQVRIRFHYFRSCVITNSTMQQKNDIVSVSKVFAIF